MGTDRGKGMSILIEHPTLEGTLKDQWVQHPAHTAPPKPYGSVPQLPGLHHAHCLQWQALPKHPACVVFMLLKNKPEGSGSSLSSPSSPMVSTQSFGHVHRLGFKVCFSTLNCTSNSIINMCNAKQTSYLHPVSHILLGSTRRRCAFITVPRIQWSQSDTKCFFISHWTIDAPEFPNNKY